MSKNSEHRTTGILQGMTEMAEVDSVTVNLAARWQTMLRRCYVPEDPCYEYYGGRGIRVCKDWLDFWSFLDFWKAPPFDGATIGRINNNGHYEPANCRWESQEQQNNNTRRSRFITWNGKTQTIRDWACEYNVGTRRLSERLRRGWTMERALHTPSPQDFDAELEDRRIRNQRYWRLHGHSCRLNSKRRKSQQGSLLEVQP